MATGGHTAWLVKRTIFGTGKFGPMFCIAEGVRMGPVRVSNISAESGSMRKAAALQ